MKGEKHIKRDINYILVKKVLNEKWAEERGVALCTPNSSYNKIALKKIAK